MSPTACLEKCPKKEKLSTLVPEVLSVGEPKGLFWWCHYEYLETGRKLSQFIDLAPPHPGDFYFGWLANLCTEEAQKSMETQSIFTRVVVWSYFFMIWERIQCWIRKNLHMGAKKIYQRFFVSPLHWILPWLEHKKKLNHLTNSCEGVGSDVSN